MGDEIDVSSLGERFAPRQTPPELSFLGDELSIKKATKMVERELIRRCLEQSQGNRTRAAELLEISHRALLYKIKDYGLG